jgi:hypothetical protein
MARRGLRHAARRPITPADCPATAR